MRRWVLALVAIAPTVVAAQDGGWKALHVNEFRTPFTTFRIGGGFLVEGAGYEQDSSGRAQVAQITGVAPTVTDGGGDDIAMLRATSGRTASATSPAGTLLTAGKIRDSRLIVSGQLSTKRSIRWQSGFMYDWIQDKWFVRQTALIVGLPEIKSNVWIGRMKEGPSLNRVMVGYDGWTMERFTFSDAAIPLLADGFRWQGYLPDAHFVWNLGYFVDVLSEGETWSYFTNQAAGRLGYLRMDSDTAGSLVHVAVNFQAGIPNEGLLQLKSKPEASGAPNFVDTGKFPASSAQLLGIEAYYRPGPLLIGAEYFAERARSPATDNPVFHGGDASVMWNVTGETRRYIVPGSYFDAVSPARPVFHGGPGAWEVGLRFSNTDLNAGSLHGGRFWRWTPVVNWHLSDEVRLEFEYGYGALDRFGLIGHTHFYQSRIQLQL
jgi:phosphate-selective porin OprO/OprP